MQKLLRILIMLLLLVVVGGIVYTQTQLYGVRQAERATPAPTASKAQRAVAAIAWMKPVSPPVAAPAVAAASPLLSPALGTEAMPLVVRLAPKPVPADDAGEHSKDREALLGIEHSLAQLVAATRAQNFLFIFQAIIYFLTLILLFLMLENMKKFSDAIGKSAEAAKKSAEAAEGALKRCEKPAMRKFPPRFYRKR